MEELKHIVILVTCKNNSEAERISEHLIQEHLAACTNIIPKIQSVFHWQGAIEHEEEALMIIKSQRQHLNRIAENIKHEHSYDTPEIIALPIIGGSDEYLSWIVEETNLS